MNRDKQFFIVIEGIDGSGKATQAELLAQYLNHVAGIKTEKISFPRYESEACGPIKMYLSGKFGSASEVNCYASSILYTVDRYASFREYFGPKMDEGYAIVADRYTESNMVHQASKAPKDKWDEIIDWIADLEYDKVGLPKPDLVIYLDVNPEVSKKLISKRYQGDESKRDIHEADIEFMNRSRTAALFAAQKCNWVVLECSDDKDMRSIEDIHKDIVNIVSSSLL